MIQSKRKTATRPQSGEDLHCAMVIPDYAENDFWRGQYSPWFLAHRDPEELTAEHLEKLAAEYRTGNDGHLHDAVDGLGPFLGWLLRRGYRVLHTAAEQPIVFYDLPKAD